MMQAVLRYLLGGIPAPPPLGRATWVTLGVLVFSIVNVVGRTELWPHTPVLGRWLPLAAGLAALLGSQVTWVDLAAYTGGLATVLALAQHRGRLA